ncbi:MAG: flagellar export protein FliJ [Hydrogenophaga sp.]|uniref:flagellar export protein FliJ n=1 Tax=Hydrogenophaga sp. TaxID=1904254 RepID=UPI001D62A89B|nr:flagellar export protein FliJ [Hydrogenophaga sp.]MBX3609671.1 flagellar export protein FliJ [Hydrogenophaga sp.]
MSAPAQQLNKVIELAERRRDEALGQLARLRGEHQQAQAQMDQLTGYVGEAERRWSERGASGVDVALLMHHRQFMAKLDHAIAFQHNVLSERVQQVEQAQSIVIEAERELASLRKVAARQMQTWLQQLQRRDQKHTDEMAQNAHRRRLDNDSSFQPMSS